MCISCSIICFTSKKIKKRILVYPKMKIWTIYYLSCCCLSHNLYFFLAILRIKIQTLLLRIINLYTANLRVFLKNQEKKKRYELICTFVHYICIFLVGSRSGFHRLSSSKISKNHH